MLRMLLLQLPGRFLGAVEIERINLFENAGCFRRQRELRGADPAGRKRQKKKANDAGAAKRRQGSSGFHSRKVSHKDQGLRWTSLSCSVRVANRNGFCK